MFLEMLKFLSILKIPEQCLETNANEKQRDR